MKFNCKRLECETKCQVCRYMNFREWAVGCAPAGSTIESDEEIENWLKARKIMQEIQRKRGTPRPKKPHPTSI